MDITMDFDNLLLLLTSLSSYVSAAADGISIIGKVADSSMVREETMEIGEIKDVVNPLMAPSMVVDASAAEREADVPPLILEEVARGGSAGEGIINEPYLAHI